MTTTDDQVGDLRHELGGSAAELLRRFFVETSLREVVEEDDLFAVWPRLADAGWFQLLAASDHGGLGLDIRDALPVCLAAGEHGLPGPLWTHVVAVPLIASTDPVATRLADAATGDLIVALADPHIDLNPFRMSAPPVVDDDGLRGRVDLVPFGGDAAEIIVCAAGSEGGPVLVLVDAMAAGVEVTEVASMDPSTRYAAIDFAVEPGQLLTIAQGDAAAALMRDVRTCLRLALAGQLCGLAVRLASIATEYARTREQFGRPIGSFQAVKHLLADIAVRVTSLHNLCTTVMDELENEALEVLSLVAKARAAEAARQVSHDALQVLGGIGFTWEHDLHLYLKQVHSLVGVYGDERELAALLGRHLIAHGMDGAAHHDVMSAYDVRTGW